MPRTACANNASIFSIQRNVHNVKIVFDSNPNDSYWIVSDRVISKLKTLI